MKKILLTVLTAAMMLTAAACAAEPPIDQPVASEQTIEQVNDEAMLVTPEEPAEATPAKTEPVVSEGTADMTLADSDLAAGIYKLKFLTVTGDDEGLSYNFTGEEGFYTLAPDAKVMLPYVMDDYSIPDYGDLVEWEPDGMAMFFDAWKAAVPDIDPMFTVAATDGVISELTYFNIP